ncbi:MAG TPA: hypothetical protein VJ873_07170 [bacterium]|nr:hypothetical protein [bacterium]
MKRWLLENLGLKLLAVFIAFSLWAYVGSRQVLERRMTLHIEFTDIPAGVTLGSGVRTSIPVVLVGRPESLVDLDPGALAAVVSLRGCQPGQKEITVHPKIPDLPEGVKANVSDFQVPLIVPVSKDPTRKKSRR